MVKMQDSLFGPNQAKPATQTKNSKNFADIKSLFEKYQIKDKPGYISREFQDFGYRLALELGDLERVSLYMRLAKNESRATLEQALSFVSDANARNKARLFMWKVKQLKDAKKDKSVNEK